MIELNMASDNLTLGEKKEYLKHANEKYPNTDGYVDIYADGDYVDLHYMLKERDGVPFQRIRRITGYLVGTLDRFNNAKRVEVEDRVKHTGV